MSKNFAEYSKYYNLLYKDKDYVQECQFIDSLIKKFAPGAKTILDLGCGTAKHISILKNMGYEVTGVDLSYDMIKIAKENYPQLKIHQGNVRDVRLNEKFDVVISLFHVLSYQNSNAELDQFFQTISEHLNVNGIAIFDYWYGPAVLELKPESRIKKIIAENAEVIRFAESKLNVEKNIVTINYDLLVLNSTQVLLRDKETHSMRYFFTPEMDYFISANRLKNICSSTWNTINQEPDQTSWSVYNIVQL